MPKKINNVFNNNLTFEKILAAHNRAKIGKVYKPEVILFEMNLENNIINLLNQLKNNQYNIGDYRSFKVYEPKERIIMALPYIDRIVHQWYVEEFIKPYIVPRFIDTSFACITNKGTHKAVEKVQSYLQKYEKSTNNFWILKCDIRKFFYNINPHILYSILCKYIKDKKLLNLTKLLIFEKREALGNARHTYWQLYFSIFCKYLSK